MSNERKVRSVSLNNGSGTVLFEVQELNSEGDIPTAVEVARDDFSMDNICSTVRSVADAVREGLSAIKAKRTVIEFGVEIGAESGHMTAFIVKGSGKASLNITVEW